MRFFLDTEFTESGPGKPIYPLSVGLVGEDRREFYVEIQEGLDHRGEASQWVRDNVFPHMHAFRQGGCPDVRFGGEKTTCPVVAPAKQAAEQIRLFVGPQPEFWADYASYDWVVLCQLFGTMLDLPVGWPMFVRDLRQWASHLGLSTLPKTVGIVDHHALGDAREVRDRYEYLSHMQGRANDLIPGKSEEPRA